ncbi:acetyl-coenzyme A transporter 1-domain-containing protein [Tuber indicum]|nr:acetyl-coenzyme A transporter 1-domain-containing protein [Tuber indicum]
MSPAPLSESRDPLLPLTSSSSSTVRAHRSNSSAEHPDDFELENIYVDDLRTHCNSDDPATPSSPMARSRKDRHHDNDRSSSANMNSSSSVEYRRKNASVDGHDLLPSSMQTETLLQRESFSLDDDHDKQASASLKDLSPQDQKNFALLVLLYFLQGVPMGLAMGSVPFLLKSRLSYGEIGVFSLASYPYSMKLLWSPIVDAIWSKRMGRRKSWIVPIQALSAIMLLWLGANADRLMAEASGKLYTFTFVFFSLVMLCATQDVAVDGWALTLLSVENLSYASTAQTVGLTAGNFLSFTVFLAFNSPDFANRYFRTTPSDVGLFTLGGYLTFWGWAYLIVTLGLAVFKKEERTSNRDGLVSVYKTMWRVIKLKHVQTFIIIHLIAKIGFQANDAVTNLKLLEKGFTQEDMALTVLIDFPFEIGLGYYAGKWCAYFPPMTLWMWAFIGRLLAAVLAHITVWIFPSDGVVESGYLMVVIAEHIFSTFTSTVMFVAVSAFHAKIADPGIGGTYMTLLATVSNLGGTFPRIFVLKLVDAFTIATCTPLPDAKTPFESFSCALEGDKKLCKTQGGVCNIEQDGYYITNVICIIIGVVTFWGYIKPAATRLSALPLKSWREASGPRSP